MSIASRPAPGPAHRPTSISSVRHATREVLAPGLLREAARARQAAPPVVFALRVGLIAGVCLAVPAATGHRELATFAALGSLTTLYGRGPYRRRGPMLALAGALMVGSIGLFTLIEAAGAPAFAGFVLVAVLAAGISGLIVLLRAGAPGATIIVFGAGAGLAGSPTLDDVVPRTIAAAGGALLAWLGCMAGAVVRRRLRNAVTATGETPLTLRAQARASWPTEDWRLAVTRVLAASLAASAVGVALGLQHTAWAVMGATAVLHGATTRHVAVRAVQRAAGTAAGALLIAYPLLSAPVGFWGRAAVIMVLQAVTELVIVRHYGLAQLTITPMALLMVTLGQPVAAGDLTVDRAAQTAIGAAAGLLAAVAIHHCRPFRRSHHAGQGWVTPGPAAAPAD